MPPKKTKSGSKSKPSEQSEENASDSEEEVTELEFVDAAPILDIGTVLSETPSERFSHLFPPSRGVGPYAWPANQPKIGVAPPPFDKVSIELTGKAASSKLHQAWLKEWEVLQPTITTEVIAAQAAHELAVYLAQEDPSRSNIGERAAQLAQILESLLECHLKRATVIIAGAHDPALASKVDNQFAAEALGIHPDALSTFKEHKPQHYQRQGFARHADQASSKPTGRGRGRGTFKPKSSAQGSATSSASADKGSQ